MDEQHSGKQKLSRIKVLRTMDKGSRTPRWFKGETTPPDEDRGEATAYLLEHCYIEEVSGYPERAPIPFRLTAKGKALLPQVETTYRKILQRHSLGADLTGPDPLDEFTYFD